MDIDDICSRIVQMQRDRRLAMRTYKQIDNSTNAFIRNRIGFNVSLPEEQRRKLVEAARSIRTCVERGEEDKGIDLCGREVFNDCLTAVVYAKPALHMQEKMWTISAARMTALARTLPVYPWVESIRGVTALGLAAIVGEAGNIGAYPTHGHLFKRLGIGLVDGKRQGAPGMGATREDWIRHGYVASRRGEVWAFLDNSMLRAQWRGARDGRPGYPLGPYGAHYQRKLAEYVAREHRAPVRAARRYAAQRFLEDLWRAWRHAEPTDHVT